MSAAQRHDGHDGHDGHDEPSEPGDGHKGHGWLMIACCIPMLLIAVAIALSGAGYSFLILALICTAMMAAMMGGTSHGSDDSRR